MDMQVTPMARRAGSWLAAGLLGLALQGCATPASDSLASPPPLHRHGNAPETVDPKNPEHLALQAGFEMTTRYYRALDKAKADGASQQAIDHYVDQGIALVEVHCLRWFSLVAEAQRKLQLGDTNRNVISALATSLIGIGRLHPDVTAVWGAGMTATAGFNANVGSLYLAAPNAENVKRLAMSALHESAAHLAAGGSKRPKTFAEAYARLEAHADLCTHAEIKRLTTQSVENASVNVSSETGEANAVPKPELVKSAATRDQASLASRLAGLIKRIDTLPDDEAVALARVMPFRSEWAADLDQVDPNQQRMTRPLVARQVLNMSVTRTVGNADRLRVWDALVP